MTLTELLVAIETQGHIPASRSKDLKTSIRYLARALGKSTPDACHEADFILPTAIWKDKLDTYFGSLQSPPSPHTVRNTHNNLSLLFRIAQETDLLTHSIDLPVLSPKRMAHKKAAILTSPYRQRWLATHSSRYRLSPDDWPLDIQDAWKNYCLSRQLKARKVTFYERMRHLGGYIGFLITIEGLSIQWDDLFDVAYIDRFVRWQSQRSQTPITVASRFLVQTLRILAAHTDHPSLSALKRYERDLPIPEPMHDKKDHWITLRELETIGLSLLKEACKPLTTVNKKDRLLYPSYLRDNQHPGLMRAVQHQLALILRLMVRIPIRSRNIREMQIDRNLYQDEAGHWHLHFRGSELKVSTRNGRTNTYHIDLTDYCPDLIPHLEEFLTAFRPRIPQPSTTSYVFATRYGNPFRHEALRNELADLVLRRTNKRFYPHLIRTIWATEFISKTHDFTTAAHMLGDTVQVVLKRYQEILEKDHQDKANQFLTAALR
jgi:hypothetical protein